MKNKLNRRVEPRERQRKSGESRRCPTPKEFLISSDHSIERKTVLNPVTTLDAEPLA